MNPIERAVFDALAIMPIIDAEDVVRLTPQANININAARATLAQLAREGRIVCDDEPGLYRSASSRRK